MRANIQHIFFLSIVSSLYLIGLADPAMAHDKVLQPLTSADRVIAQNITDMSDLEIANCEHIAEFWIAAPLRMSRRSAVDNKPSSTRWTGVDVADSIYAMRFWEVTAESRSIDTSSDTGLSSYSKQNLNLASDFTQLDYIYEKRKLADRCLDKMKFLGVKRTPTWRWESDSNGQRGSHVQN